MDDQREDCGPSTGCIGGRGPDDTADTPRRVTRPPAVEPHLSIGERAELRVRLAELSAVVDTVESALRDARDAGLKVTPRHKRVAAMTAAAASLLRALNQELD